MSRRLLVRLVGEPELTTDVGERRHPHHRPARRSSRARSLRRALLRAPRAARATAPRGRLAPVRPSVLHRLGCIVAAEEAGFALEEVKALLETEDEPGWRALVEAKLEVLRGAINPSGAETGLLGGDPRVRV